MQTFLPYRNYEDSAKVLDSVRLMNQRRESMSLITSIENNSGWINHPCAKMWTPYLYQLSLYSVYICIECLSRGFNDKCLSFFEDKLEIYRSNKTVPHWLGNKHLHLSHQSNLLRKDQKYYSKFFPGVVNFLPYYWPD